MSLNPILAMVLCGLADPAPLTAQDTVAATMAELIATARAPWARWPDFAGYVDEVKQLYEVSPATTIWHDGSWLSSKGKSANAALRTASEHGLDYATWGPSR